MNIWWQCFRGSRTGRTCSWCRNVSRPSSGCRSSFMVLRFSGKNAELHKMSEAQMQPIMWCSSSSPFYHPTSQVYFLQNSRWADVSPGEVEVLHWNVCFLWVVSKGLSKSWNFVALTILWQIWAFFEGVWLLQMWVVAPGPTILHGHPICVPFEAEPVNNNSLVLLKSASSLFCPCSPSELIHLFLWAADGRRSSEPNTLQMFKSLSGSGSQTSGSLGSLTSEHLSWWVRQQAKLTWRICFMETSEKTDGIAKKLIHRSEGVLWSYFD